MHPAILGLILTLPMLSVVDTHKHDRHIVVDFSKPSTEKRLYVIDDGQVVFSTFVAHGKRSGKLYARHFSNKPNSNMSSLGTYVVSSVYHGKNGISYRLIGLDSTNNNVYKRNIVIHSSKYIGYGKIGRSLGCLAIPKKDYPVLRKYLKENMKIIVKR